MGTLREAGIHFGLEREGSLSQAEEDTSDVKSGNDCAASPALRRLVEQGCLEWQSELMAFLMGVLRNQHLAEEAFQKMALAAIQSAESVHPETLRGWLFRIALNEARLLQRHRVRDLAVREKLAGQISEQSFTATRRGQQWWSKSELLETGVVETISRSLQKLPQEQRLVIQKRVYDGLTFAEIAQQLGQPLGTVLTWMRRGLNRLREDSGLRDLWTE